MYFKKNIKLAVFNTFLIAGVVTSCTVKNYQRPESEIPQKFRNQSDSTKSISIAKISYKDFFKDPVLITLIDKAMIQNNDLLVSFRQIQSASLAFEQSKWGNIPKVNANLGSANITRPSDNSVNGIMASQFLGSKYTQDYNSTINIVWEADIWGKIRATKEESLVDLLKTQEAVKAIKTRLVAEIVQGYYNLLMLDKQLQISKENLEFSERTLTILKKQYDLGIINSLAVEQQEITREQILKNIPVIESSISIQENALNILTGAMPDKIERKISLENVEVPELISTGIPSELLSYRPDVKSRELDLRKSFATVHMAKVSMYPGINVTAQGGLNSFKAMNWFNVPGSLFGLVTGTITQPLINNRQLKTRYEQSKIESQQAEINFKQSLLSAVGEVSDAMVQIDKLEEQQLIAESLVKKADTVVNNSLTLYKYGEATYLEVIIAQANKLQSELDLASIKTAKLNTIAILYRSLGGGWQ